MIKEIAPSDRMLKEIFIMPEKTEIVQVIHGRGNNIFLLVLMAQLQLWDGIITQTFVAVGLARESNRIAAHMINQGNYIALKVAGILMCVALLWILGRYCPALTKLAAIVVSVFYAAVIIWNFAVLFSG